MDGLVSSSNCLLYSSTLFNEMSVGPNQTVYLGLAHSVLCESYCPNLAERDASRDAHTYQKLRLM